MELRHGQGDEACEDSSSQNHCGREVPSLERSVLVNMKNDEIGDAEDHPKTSEPRKYLVCVHIELSDLSANTACQPEPDFPAIGCKRLFEILFFHIRGFRFTWNTERTTILFFSTKKKTAKGNLLVSAR